MTAWDLLQITGALVELHSFNTLVAEANGNLLIKPLSNFYLR